MSHAADVGVDGTEDGLGFRFHGRDTVQVLESWTLFTPSVRCTPENLKSALRGLRDGEDPLQPEDPEKVAVPEFEWERTEAAEKLAAIVAVSTALGLELERAQLRRQTGLVRPRTCSVQPFKTRAAYSYRASVGKNREAESEWAQILAWRAAEYGGAVLRGVHLASATAPDLLEQEAPSTDPRDLEQVARSAATLDLNWICDKLQPAIGLICQALLRNGSVSGPFARIVLKRVLGPKGLQSIASRRWRSRSVFECVPKPAASAAASSPRTVAPASGLEAPDGWTMPGNKLRN